MFVFGDRRVWAEVRLRRVILDAGLRAGAVSESEYRVVLSRWGYTPLAAQRELDAAREGAQEDGAGAAGGAIDVHRAEHFVDSRCNGCGVPKQARW